ncbi:MAG: glycine cleavage system aminomethyltransferase GcvT, partial [Aggregatilineales bacterium]
SMASATEYHLAIDQNIAQVAAWLRSLSDGFVILDSADVYAKVPGSVDVAHVGTGTLNMDANDSGYAIKGYHVGLNGKNYAGDLPDTKTAFSWSEPEVDTLLKTPLHAVHQELGGKMAEFAGYNMPLWYDKVLTEHMAVREGVGIFDVTHMGVFEATGAGAEAFLNAVTTNDVTRLKVGSSHYTFLLDVDGIPHDDLLIYRRGDEHFMLVVNASNNDKNWAWLTGIKDDTIMIDDALPGRTLRGADFELRDLRAESSGADRRVDIALQGPKSRDILMSLTDDAATKSTIKKMIWGSVRTVTLGDFDLILSRTGYTGERIAYEVFPHPDQAAALFKTLIEAGATPCGLAARDSLRIEAGLPLYGHELAGDLNMNPADAGMGNYVKLHKPFFIGKTAFIQHEINRDKQLIRFRMDNKGARPAHQGDPLVDGRGRVVGLVTSCSVDSDGYQLGHAYIKREFRFRGTALSVFAGSARAKVKSISQTKIGDKVTMPEPVKVISRFPKRK